ncbi:hypothetical protein MUK42_34167 [Musa troglodytarum]|uniref:Uncharacterized protein n=1 Tax=Musa troglodytarum TaxID=320322 RepID=A0A9E7G190_9LILI|nr:hypothetical protein MUK42_34167 [Musa troglodytarum]
MSSPRFPPTFTSRKPPPGCLVALAAERPSGSPASVMLDEEVPDLESEDRGISGGGPMMQMDLTVMAWHEMQRLGPSFGNLS